jgi:hypothetical protein
MTVAAFEYDVPTERGVSTEEVLLGLLRNGGVRTLDDLAETSGLDWAQVFLAIDRLSRSGDVSLRRAGRLQYQVSMTREDA